MFQHSQQNLPTQNNTPPPPQFLLDNPKTTNIQTHKNPIKLAAILIISGFFPQTSEGENAPLQNKQTKTELDSLSSQKILNSKKRAKNCEIQQTNSGNKPKITQTSGTAQFQRTPPSTKRIPKSYQNQILQNTQMNQTIRELLGCVRREEFF